MQLLISLIAAYLLGSIPSAYIAGRFLGSIDIREQGSGNVGTMNTGKVLGWPAAGAVFVCDFCKGVLAVCINYLTGINMMLLAVMAVLGHCYPIWLGFRGGKGLATALGAFIAAWQLWPIVFFVSGWLLAYPLLKQTDQANLAGIFIVLLYALFSGPDWWMGLLAGLIAVRHMQALANKPSV